MSKLFTKGNNFMRQLGHKDSSKELAWKQVSLANQMASEEEPKITKVLANQGQTCLMTDEGSCRSQGMVVVLGWHFDHKSMSKATMYYKRFPGLMTLAQVASDSLRDCRLLEMDSF